MVSLGYSTSILEIVRYLSFYNRNVVFVHSMQNAAFVRFPRIYGPLMDLTWNFARLQYPSETLYWIQYVSITIQ